MIKVTQWYAENPQYYAQFDLPGHEGLDMVAPTGEDVFAVANGTVYDLRHEGNYGLQVRLLHADGFKTTYAHLQATSVILGQNVVGGQKLGDADNTGNSYGSHLHLSEKQEGVNYTDENGTVWPFNFRDPWIHLQPVYEAWLVQNGIVGYVTASGLVKNLQGNYARAYGTLNIRATPSSAGTLLGQITSHTVVRITGAAVGGYYPVVTPIDVHVTPPATRPKFGLHFRADPDANVSPAEYNEQQILINEGGNTAKLLHAHPQSVFETVCNQRPTVLVIRVFQTGWENRVVTAQNFFDWTVHELIQRVNLVRSRGITPVIEVHNEPNLVQEGLGLSWEDGNKFGIWLRDVINLYKTRSELTSVSYMYPGLSPGGTVAGVRQDSTAFLQQSISSGVMNHVNAMGVHAYWSAGFPMQSAINHVNQTKNTTGKPTYVTEASINDRPSVLTPQQYGDQYAEFIQSVAVEGIYFFVGSASNSYFEPETWVRTNGTSKGIAASLANSL